MVEKTLHRIEDDFASGDYGKARNGLPGLLATYRDALAVRRKLGDVYWQLQYPTVPGRYWYLDEEESPAMIAACRVFERSCGNDPVWMLLAPKFRGDIEAIGDMFAGCTLLALQERAREERDCHIEFGKRGSEKFQYTSQYGSRSRWLLIGCLVGSVIALGLIVVGRVTIFQ